jgi:hypothetical protein
MKKNSKHQQESPIDDSKVEDQATGYHAIGEIESTRKDQQRQAYADREQLNLGKELPVDKRAYIIDRDKPENCGPDCCGHKVYRPSEIDELPTKRNSPRNQIACPGREMESQQCQD